jgi:succinoglycan biosynthesis transport protein ExoP
MVVMGKTFRYSLLLVKRWLWMLVLSAIICGSVAYLLSLFLRPVYQASAYLIVDLGSASPGTQDVTTFAQYITAPGVLDPVVAQHPGINRQTLLTMISINPQTGRQVIELDVQNTDPRLAANLANQVAQSFAQYANSGMPGAVQVIQAAIPNLPSQAGLFRNAGIGAAFGLAIAVLLIFFFKGRGSQMTSVGRMQKLLGREIIAILPDLSHYAGQPELQPSMAEKYFTICSRLDLEQANRPFKLMMFTGISSEEKSAVVSNVAINLAQAGKQVLLIDLNIHCPVLAREFHLASQIGLTNLLVGDDAQWPFERYIQATGIPGLRVLAAGTQKMNSTEFLRFLAATQFFAQIKRIPFDYILFDAPPLPVVAAAPLLLSSIEAMVLVVNGLHTSRKLLTQARKVLLKVQMPGILGVVVHQCSWRDYARVKPALETQVAPAGVANSLIEQTTLALPPVPVSPTLAYERLETAELVAIQEQMHFPNTGETESIKVGVPEPIIRPMLSLNGLAMPTNGLTGRFFGTPHTPQPL